MELVAQCESCFGLCCVGPGFVKSVDFAVDKAAGVACRNLSDDFRCVIHGRLRTAGFRGCEVFDCWGPGSGCRR